MSRSRLVRYLSLSLSLSLVLGAAPAGAQPGGSGRWESPVALPPRPCVDRISPDDGLDEAVRALALEVGGQARPLGDVRITGLRTLAEADVWKAVGGRPERADARAVAVLVRRLGRWGVFSRVAPVIRVDETVTVDIAVTEQPRVRTVVLEGLTEVRPERLLQALLRAPFPPVLSRRSRAGGEGEVRRERDEAPSTCLDPAVPLEWLARAEGDAVHAGVLWNGPRPALARLVRALHDLGYEMASLTAALDDDGVFAIQIDEGRLEAVEIRGVAPRLEPQVRARLGLQIGHPLQVGDLAQAVARVQAAFPFLRPTRGPRSTPHPLAIAIEEEPATPGARRFKGVPAAPAPRARSADDDENGDSDNDDFDHGDRSAGRWYSVQGRRLVVTFAARRFDLDLDPSELIRHTPVTGFAPGTVASAHLWDPGNQVHLGIDLGGNVNTNRARRPLADPTVTPLRWRADWLVGGRVQLPLVHVTELGVQRYSRVDTTDRWRIDRLDSYLYSALFNRPVTDYFHRDGLTAFVTTRWFERLVAGLEYRRDRYVSLASIDRYFTLFYRREPPRLSPPITEGEMRSILVRLEYSTRPSPAHEVRGIWRDPERALATLAGRDRWRAELRTVNTVEIADPGLLGGDAAFHFVRMLSDTVVQESVRVHHSIKVRFRAAGRLGDGSLPRQKEEALGGWSALRGYDFKEMAGGNFSLLGTVEYRYHEVSVFFDGGQVRTGSSFGPMKVAGGLALNLGSSAHLDVAWRLDDGARLAPAVRFFFNRTF
jgi:hypothetical protein